MLLRDRRADKPRVGAVIVDSTVSREGEVLRSEVAAAIAFLKDQLLPRRLPQTLFPARMFCFPLFFLALVLSLPSSCNT